MRFLLVSIGLLFIVQSEFGQTAGQFGLSVKAQLVPQVGINWQVTDVLIVSMFNTGAGILFYINQYMRC